MSDTSGFIEPLYVWGTLKSLVVNVQKADTTTPGISPKLALTANGFDTTLAASNLTSSNINIDLTTVGIRTITPTTASTPLGTDTLAAYAGWLSGNITGVWTLNTGQGFNKAAAVVITITTDQGIFTLGTPVYYQDPNYGHIELITDNTTVPQG
jgi:hypothetical protein